MKDIAQKLFRIDDKFGFGSFELTRKNALVALTFKEPVSMAKILTDRFYSNEASIGQKLVLLDVIEEVVGELASYTEVSPAKKDNHNKMEDFFGPTDDSKIKIKEISDTRVSENTRIWGKKRLAQLSQPTKPQSKNLLAASYKEFAYRLLHQITNKQTTLQLLSAEGENLLIKLIVTLSKILEKAALAVDSVEYVKNLNEFLLFLISTDISSAVKISIIFVVSKIPNAIRSADLILSDNKLGVQIREIMDWLGNVIENEKKEEVRTLAAGSYLRIKKVLDSGNLNYKS